MNDNQSDSNSVHFQVDFGPKIRKAEVDVHDEEAWRCVCGWCEILACFKAPLRDPEANAAFPVCLIVLCVKWLDR